ncbi:MAG TPA: hypothetical protein VGR96_16705 [Acidobacteriaceae bacterium]|nr:hypothetical protein [Acidobacteriaceae bacterium]
MSAFATFTDVKPDFRYYGDLAVYGISAGGIIQTRHFYGAEARGTLLRMGGMEHQESLLGGPRAALHFSHLTPYGAFLGGVGNAWWWNNPRHTGQPEPKLDEAIGPEWSLLGGVDLHFNRRLSFRLGEFSYSKIYVTNRTLTPLGASAGFVFRIN